MENVSGTSFNSSGSWHGWNVLLAAALTISVLLNVILSQRLSQLGVRQSDPPINVGAQLPNLTLQLADGSPETIQWNRGERTLLYFMDPDCGWCKKNAQSFEDLARQLKGRMTVYMYSTKLKGLEHHLKPNQDFAKIVIDGKDDARNILRLKATPTTLLINQNGRVDKVWEGAYVGSLRHEIARELSVPLKQIPN